MKKIFNGILLFALICSLIFNSSCSKKDGTSSESTIKTNQLAEEVAKFLEDENPDDDIRKILLAGLKEAKPKGTIEKIRSAFYDGKMTEEEAVMLALQAVYNPENVPGEYRGSDTGEGIAEINAEMQWIQDNWDQLDEKTREKLLPYYVEPDHPDSIFNQLNSDDRVSIRDIIFPANAVYAESPAERWAPELISTSDFKGLVRIHYYDPSVSDSVNDKMKEKAIQVVEAVLKAWPMYKSLLKVEPNNYTDIFMVNFKDPKILGGARWITPDNRCEILIRKSLSGKELQSTAVHELFHCFQYYMSLRFRMAGPDINWLLEATATWAEHYVYPEFNVEHEHLGSFFGTLHQEIVQYNGTKEYESYMLIFFMTQYLGDATYVYKVLNDVKEGADARMAIMESLPNYHDAYAEFALYNWNQEPWQAYQDIPKFPDDIPYGESVVLRNELRAEDKEYSVPIQKGGIQYQCHTFTQDVEKIQKVKFDFGSINTDDLLQRQALIKIGDVWHLEEWDSLSEREFCRKNADENVKMVILVFSNANLKSADNAYYKLNTLQACDAKRVGFTRITQTFDGGDLLNVKAVYESYDTIAYLNEEDSEDFCYVLTERDMNFTFSQSGQWETVAGKQTGTVSGSGTLQEKYALDEDAPQKLTVRRNGSVSFLIAPETIDQEWVEMVYSLSGAGGTQQWTKKSGAVLQDLSGMTIDLDKNEILDNKIKGKREFDAFSPFGPARTVVEFEYDLP